MNLNKSAHFLAFLLLAVYGVSGQNTQLPVFSDSLKLFSTGAELRKISSQFIFTEGPAADKAGNIYFTDQPNDKIWKYSIAGELSLFMEKAGRSNGLAFDKNGNLISCADEKNQLWSINSKGKIDTLMWDYQGLLMNGPNDLWLDSGDGIYFTDPYYQRDYWTRKKADLPGQRIYYLPKGKKQAVMLDSTLLQPNGITGSRDGKYLFVADIRDNKTYRYAVTAPGKLGERTLFIPQGSDGITLDQQGNLYISGRGVTVFNPEGIKIAYLPVPSRWVGNICFGGKERKTLFITATESIYTIEMNVKGAD